MIYLDGPCCAFGLTDSVVGIEAGFDCGGASEALPVRLRTGFAMTDNLWAKELPIAITVLDAEGIILEMNDKSAATFAADGGMELIGKSAMDCHPEPAHTKLRQLLQAPKANVYTIEKAGVKKLICQTPWSRNGKFAGIVEFSIQLPAEVPHFVRD